MSEFWKWAGDLADQIGSQGSPETEPECDTCEGEGWHMGHVCYGGPPLEVRMWCLDCGGSMAGKLWDDD